MYIPVLCDDCISLSCDMWPGLERASCHDSQLSPFVDCHLSLVVTFQHHRDGCLEHDLLFVFVSVCLSRRVSDNVYMRRAIVDSASQWVSEKYTNVFFL